MKNELHNDVKPTKYSQNLLQKLEFCILNILLFVLFNCHQTYNTSGQINQKKSENLQKKNLLFKKYI